MLKTVCAVYTSYGDGVDRPTGAGFNETSRFAVAYQVFDLTVETQSRYLFSYFEVYRSWPLLRLLGASARQGPF